jgi:ATP-dependent RNA helicase MSS116, mitochondrial
VTWDLRLISSWYSSGSMMLGVARRCSASACRAILSVRFVPQHVRPFPLKTGLSGPQAPKFAPIARLLHSTPERTQYATAEASERPSDESGSSSRTHSPATRFEELGTRNLVHPNIVRTLTQSMNLVTMTEIQSATVEEGLTGVDMYGQNLTT